MSMFYAFTEGQRGGPVYQAEVNKGSINMRKFTETANARWHNGYIIAHLYEQAGNTVVVWMRYDVPPHQVPPRQPEMPR